MKNLLIWKWSLFLYHDDIKKARWILFLIVSSGSFFTMEYYDAWGEFSSLESNEGS